MKKLVGIALLTALFAFGASALAAVNASVHIAYPISDSRNNNYFKVSFSATCPGGQNEVKWSFDGKPVGYATFYENFNTQFLHKLPTGWHGLEVTSSCGVETVKFYVN